MALAQKFYEYVPPPGRSPNPFAEFVSGRLAMRTPLVMALTQDLLKGNNPAQRDAYLKALADKEAKLAEQIARSNRDAAKLAAAQNASTDDLVKSVFSAAANVAVEGGRASETQVQVEGNLAANEVIKTPGAREMLDSARATMGAYSKQMQDAYNAGNQQAYELAQDRLEQFMADTSKAAGKLIAGKDSGPERVAFNREMHNSMMQTMPPTGGPNTPGEAYTDAILTAFPPIQGAQVGRAGVQSIESVGQQALDVVDKGRKMLGQQVPTSSSTSSSNSTTTRGPSGSPSPRGAAAGDSTTPGNGPAPITIDTKPLEDELARTRAERARVLAEDPLRDRAAVDLQLLGGGGRRSASAPEAGSAAEGTSKEQPDFLDKSVASLVKIMGRVVAPGGQPATMKAKGGKKADDGDETGGKKKRRDKVAAGFYESAGSKVG